MISKLFNKFKTVRILMSVPVAFKFETTKNKKTQQRTTVLFPRFLSRNIKH